MIGVLLVHVVRQRQVRTRPENPFHRPVDQQLASLLANAAG